VALPPHWPSCCIIAPVKPFCEDETIGVVSSQHWNTETLFTAMIAVRLKNIVLAKVGTILAVETARAARY
jgi:hypothetical protein